MSYQYYLYGSHPYKSEFERDAWQSYFVGGPFDTLDEKLAFRRARERNESSPYGGTGYPGPHGNPNLRTIRATRPDLSDGEIFSITSDLLISGILPGEALPRFPSGSETRWYQDDSDVSGVKRRP